MAAPSAQGPPPAYSHPPQPSGGYQGQPAVVVSQPVSTGAVVVASRPPDYLIPSIISCFFCFWPTGLVAIYYSMRANTLSSVGDFEGARVMSNSAKNFMITTFVVGAIGITIIVIYQIAVAATYRS